MSYHNFKLTLIFSLLLMINALAEQNVDTKSAEPLFPAFDADQFVEKTILENGLKVLTYKKPGCGFAKVQLWVGTGSVHEEEFTGMGLSHFLEHSLFNGSKALVVDGNKIRNGYGVDDISNKIREWGGYSNAFTSQENTAYIYDVLKTRVYDSIDLMEAMVMRPDLKESNLVGEKGEVRAVINELKRGEENPSTLFWQAAIENVWGRKDYGVPIIGYVQPVSLASVTELSKYYKRRYVPNNMALVVVGDIDHEKVVDRARRAWIGPDVNKPYHPMKAFKKISFTERSLLTNERYKKIVSNKIPKVLCRIDYRAVSNSHKDAAAGTVLDMMMSTPNMSGQFQRLIERDKKFNCLSIGTNPNFDDHLGSFVISFTCESLRDVEVIKEEAQKIVESIADGKLTDLQVERSKRVILNGMQKVWSTLDGIVYVLGRGAVSRNSYKYFSDEYKAITEVTKDDLIKFSKKYLKKSNRAITIMASQKKFSASEGASQKQIFVQPAVKKKLSNGLELVTQIDNATPFFAINCGLRGGVIVEEKDNNGVGHLLSQLLGEETEKHTRQNLQDEMDKRGVSFTVQSGSNTLLISISGPREQLNWGLDLLHQITYKTVYTQKNFEFVKKKIVATVERSEKNPQSEVDRVGKSLCFKSHPYAMSTVGSSVSLNSLTLDDVKKHYKRLFGSYMVISVAGDMSSSEFVEKEIVRLFGSYNYGEKNTGSGGDAVAMTTRQSVDVPFETKQSYIQWYFHSPRHNEDKAVRRVVLRVLRKRLFDEIRVKQGLSYSAGAYSTYGFGPGSIVLYADTDSYHKLDIIRQIYMQELTKMKNHLLDNDEIRQTALSIAMGDVRGKEALSARVQSFTVNTLFGESLDSDKLLIEDLKKVSPEDIKSFVTKWLNTDKFIEVIVRNKSEQIKPKSLDEVLNN